MSDVSPVLFLMDGVAACYVAATFTRAFLRNRTHLRKSLFFSFCSAWMYLLGFWCIWMATQ